MWAGSQLSVVLNIHFAQVLKGKTPLYGLRDWEFSDAIFGGKRPDKPTNASAIGFTDSLWGFVQRCWDGDMNMRPKVAEVVTHLENAAANWDGLMPPGVLLETKVVTENSMSDSMEYREFGVLVALDISHQAMIQVEFFDILRVSPQRVPLVQWNIVSSRFRLPFNIVH